MDLIVFWNRVLKGLVLGSQSASHCCCWFALEHYEELIELIIIESLVLIVYLIISPFCFQALEGRSSDWLTSPAESKGEIWQATMSRLQAMQDNDQGELCAQSLWAHADPSRRMKKYRKVSKNCCLQYIMVQQKTK